MARVTILKLIIRLMAPLEYAFHFKDGNGSRCFIYDLTYAVWPRKDFIAVILKWDSYRVIISVRYTGKS
jgi:hypothetical protein